MASDALPSAALTTYDHEVDVVSQTITVAHLHLDSGIEQA